MASVRVGPLPDSALEAATAFHRDWLEQVRAAAQHAPEHLTVIFPPADHTHRGWRLAAVQGVAREHAPKRGDGLENDDGAAIHAALAYVALADGLTGQVLPLDGHGAGKVIHKG